MPHSQQNADLSSKTLRNVPVSVCAHCTLSPRSHLSALYRDNWQVADFHRTLIYGGVAMNPRSHLRLLYEANPLAFIAEQAGGRVRLGAEQGLDPAFVTRMLPRLSWPFAMIGITIHHM